VAYVPRFLWSSLRCQHTAAVGAHLAKRYKPATVNKMLAPLRAVLKVADLPRS
jgi:hypothetical protein